MYLFGGAIVLGLFFYIVKKKWLRRYRGGGDAWFATRYSLVFYCSLMTIGVGFLSGKGGSGLGQEDSFVIGCFLR